MAKAVETDMVLVMPPMWSVFTPPLGMAYLASTLKDKGFSVKCFDFNAELYSGGKAQVRQMWDAEIDHVTACADIVKDKEIGKWCRTILDCEPKVVGFSVFYSNHKNCLRMAKKLKKLNSKVKIVFGGPNVPFYESSIISKDKNFMGIVDYIVIGEGEGQIIELMRHIKYGEELKYTNIIDVEKYDKKEAAIRKRLLNRDYLMKNISDIPFPDFSDFDVEKYRDVQLPIMFTRGCVGRCKYCWETVLWGNYVRQRSVDNIIEEIKRNKKEYGITSYIFSDSTVNNNPVRLKELAQRLIDENLSISWWGHARVHRTLTRDYLELLKASGCLALSFGIESFSQKLLDDMGKSYNQEDIRTVIKTVHETGIKANVCFMVGFPHETEKDLSETKQFIEEYGKLMATVNVAILGIGPGTEYHERHKEFGVEFKDGNWCIPSEGNTPEVRSKRAQMLTGVLQDKAELTRGLFQKQGLMGSLKGKMSSLLKRVLGPRIVELLKDRWRGI